MWVAGNFLITKQFSSAFHIRVFMLGNVFCRILGFYRAPPVAGRRVNLEEEIEPIGEKRLMDTFFKEGKKNYCVNSVCVNYVDQTSELNGVLNVCR